MKQRPALALALVPDPELIFLDEPTAALDPVAARGVHDLVRDHAREAARPVVVTTHDLVEAQRLCDRVIILRHGRSVADGSPAELVAQFPGARSHVTRGTARAIVSSCPLSDTHTACPEVFPVFRTRTLMLSALASLVLLVPAGGLLASQDRTASSSDEPTPSSRLTQPTPGLLDPQPTPWERIEIGPDGRTLRVVFWNGVAECYGLERVDVEQVDGVLKVTVWTGTRPEAVDMACIAIAELYHTVVVLDEPLVMGGAGTPDDGAVSPGMGPGISVADAIAFAGDEILLVNGSLFIGRDGVMRLCEALMESWPPQCGGPSLVVEGLDEKAVPWQEAEGVRWTDSTQVLGRVADGILRVEVTAL